MVNITSPTQKLFWKFANYSRSDQRKQEIFFMWRSKICFLTCEMLHNVLHTANDQWSDVILCCSPCLINIIRPVLKGLLGVTRNPPLKLMIFIKVFSLKGTANRGPKAVLVVCLQGCWSTIQLRLNHIGTRKMPLSIKIFGWVLL